MPMHNYVIGDIHGAGNELEALIDTLPKPANIYLVGDLFDRGLHAPLVWDLIHSKSLHAVMGNHDYKMLQWFQGKRDWLPKHYYCALNLLIDHKISANDIYYYLKSLPYQRTVTIKGGEHIIVAHAGVLPNSPFVHDISMNIYGNKFNLDKPFWESYDLDTLVITGHLVTQGPRITKNSKGLVNSIGIDTGAVQGGPLTAIRLEDRQFFTSQSKVNWFKLVKEDDYKPCNKLIKFRNSLIAKGQT